MKILKRMILKQYNFSCNEEPQSIELNPGLYLFECWGAKGFKTEHSISEDGCLYASGGGGYASGFMFLHETKSFFVYVGKAGKSKSSTFNSNNLTYSSYYGGGATDIRLEGGEWYLFESLKTRIIVAGGSGATERYCGGVCGYFGGGNDGMNAIGFGAGGYSYISGYKDCLVFDTKISTSITHYQMKTNSFHDSNLYLTDIVLMTGHRGDGKIRITNLITFKEMNCKKNGNIHYFISVLLCYNRKNI